MLTENATDGDLSLSGGSLVTTDDRATETAQRIVSRIKTVMGEWFLDTNFGLDYRNAIWKKQTSKQARDAHIQKQALLSSGTGSKIKEYSTVHNTVDRKLTVEMTVQDIDGNIANVTVGGL